MTKRVALVTGGTGGIGTSICKQLADDGYQVIAGYYSGGNHEKAQKWQETMAAEGYDIPVAFGNITEWESCESCIEGIRRDFGSIDILVNNGGITRDSTLRKMNKDQWVDVIHSQHSEVFLCLLVPDFLMYL